MKKISQKQRILNVLKARRHISLLVIMKMWIPKYSSRISELRRDGWKIENYKVDKRSYYRLVSHGEGDTKIAYAKNLF